MKIVNIKEEMTRFNECQITAIFEDGSEKFLFGYFPEEYSIFRSELIGKTVEEAIEVRTKKDLAYLRRI